MTQAELFEIAYEAGLYYSKTSFVWTSPTADNLYPEGVYPEALEDFADLVAKREREACAKLCESSPEPDGFDLADRIRARGQA
jgi:hypothetical protein